MNIEKLLVDEVDYELYVRGISFQGSVVEKRKLLRARLRLEKLSTVSFPEININDTEELQICRDKLILLSAEVQVYRPTIVDSVFERLHTRLLHVHGRLDRIKPDDQFLELHNQLRNQCLRVIDDLQCTIQSLPSTSTSNVPDTVNLITLDAEGDLSNEITNHPQTRNKSPTGISCLPHVHFSNVDNPSMLSADWETNFSPHRPALFDSTQVSAITSKSRNNLVISQKSNLPEGLLNEKSSNAYDNDAAATENIIDTHEDSVYDLSSPSRCAGTPEPTQSTTHHTTYTSRSKSSRHSTPLSHVLQNCFHEKQASKVNQKGDHLQKFFDAMQETVRTFSPLQIEIKSKIYDLVSEYELKNLLAENIPTAPSQTPLVPSYTTSPSTSSSLNTEEQHASIWPFNDMAFSDDDFAPVDVYASNNSENVAPNPETSSVALEPQPSTCVSATDMNEEDLLLSSIDTREPEPSTNIPITPEFIRPYPAAVRNSKTNKGRKPANLERARENAEFDSTSAAEEIRNQKRKIRKPKMIYPTVTTDEDGDTDRNQLENIQAEANEIPYTLESQSVTTTTTANRISLEKIYEMLISINLHVKSIDERMKKMKFRQNGQNINLEMANTFTDTLPITNLESVEKFEELLSNKINNQAFITFMHGIGGRNIKENINRMLKTCFTNEMATRCSWLGQRVDIPGSVEISSEHEHEEDKENLRPSEKPGASDSPSYGDFKIPKWSKRHPKYNKFGTNNSCFTTEFEGVKIYLKDSLRREIFEKLLTDDIVNYICEQSIIYARCKNYEKDQTIQCKEQL
ncbi:hypothetical protein RN001_005820 [Aquatica leii]|uniref:DUF4806 domain-containing protein n=1 Tax=Aquatica leii TaxID=1421715 RepID=A0AAN7PKD9_9COLE|nr:hypothetical protein RN001_005820 [Aquatica leii]